LLLDQEIRRSRKPTKKEIKQQELAEAIEAHHTSVEVEVEGQGQQQLEVLTVPPSQEAKEEGSVETPITISSTTEAEAEIDQFLSNELKNFKEEPMPKVDTPLIDEGKTVKRRTEDGETEEVFLE
jgi:hypothetical protein